MHAIEFVWDDLKNLSRRKQQLQFGNCRKVVSREEISPHKRILWKMCRTRQTVDEKYIETDGIMDLKIDQLLITIGGESSSDSERNWYGSSEGEF